jgi:hypothetical protein
MKNTQLVKFTRPHDPVLDSMTLRTHEELKLLAKKNGEHHGRQNLPGPKESNLEPYTNDLKNGYHRLAAHVLKQLQPDTHFPEARMDIDHMKDKDKKLGDEIKKRQDENKRIQYDLGDFNPKNLQSRVRMAIWISVIIALGEVVYNTKAFQIVGENILFALIISIAVSVGVFAFSHFVPFMLKSIENKWKRRLTLLGSLALVAGLFTALAMFRSQYLATHGLTVSPVYFVVINMFFFVVSLLLSYFLLPTWAEFRENSQRINKYKNMEKNNKEIENLSSVQEANKSDLLEKNKARLQMNYYAQYCLNDVAGMYKESLGIFQSNNLLYRTDKAVPACFSATESNLEIERLKISFTNPNKYTS